MHVVIKSAFFYLAIAFLYAVSGYAGLQLAIPPGYATAIWPASGIALAVVLLTGYRAGVGVFLGSCLINSWISYQHSGVFSANLLLPAAGIGIGAALQAMAAAFWIKKYISSDDPLLKSRDILYFQGISIASCLINASIGTGVLLLAGILPKTGYLINWATWWTGDAIGCIIFAPLTLILFSPSSSQKKYNRRLFVALPLLLTFSIAIIVFKITSELETRQQRQAFEHQAAMFHNRVEATFLEYLDSLESLKGFFHASEFVSRQEFRTFTQPLLDAKTGIQALSWNPVIRDGQRDAFERQVRSDGYPGFSITEKNKSTKKLQTAARRGQYVVVNYLEPYQGNEAALGYDVSSCGTRSEALKKANETGSASTTKTISLIQGKGDRHGLLIFNPVHDPERQIQGYVTGVFQIDEILGDAHRQLNAPEFDLVLSDITEPANPRLLYRFDSHQAKEADNRPFYQWSRPLKIANRSWQLSITPASPFIYQSWLNWFVLITGFLFTSLIGVFLMIVTGRTAHIEELVHERTADLGRFNRQLNTEIKLRSHLQKEQGIRNRVLEKLSQPASLEVILDEIVNGARALHPEMACSILLLDEERRHLHHGAAAGLPDFYSRAIDGLEIAGEKNIFATALAAGKRQIVENLMTDPDWQSHQSLTRTTGLKVCCLEPIVASNGKVLGIFNAYCPQQHKLERPDLKFIHDMGQLSAIAIEKKRSAEKLRIAATAFQSHEAILVTNLQGTILRVNQAFTEITGYEASEVIGKNPKLLSSGRQSPEFYQQMYETLGNNGKWQGEIWNRRKSGEIYPEWLTITEVKNEQKQASHYVAIFSDITEKKRAEKQIRDLAFYDPLTGLPNRRLLLDRLEQEINAAKRNKNFGTVVFMDLDKFKILNDSLGHHIGDELLIQVAGRIKSCIREKDTACRLGGDEFVVLISNQAEDVKQAAKQAAIVAEKIRTAINTPFLLGNSEQSFSTSIGISLFPETTDKANAILQQADTAMYRSKETGRNAINFFRPSMQEAANNRLQFEKELRNAVSNQEFQLLYQPQVDENGDVVSIEALIRWQHPEKGTISPLDFIAIAEDTNLIFAIGEWVLNTACQQMKDWERRGIIIDHIAVNVSAKQFHQPEFIGQVACALNASGLSAKRLMLELTEGVVIENISDTIAKMLTLTEMGISISIDDFGTGYSSLSYLKQLPLTQLKIDRSFVKDIATDPNDAVIVETIIEMAHNLGLSVVAEGVENEEQVSFLKQKSCSHFQGYYFDRPVPAAEIEKMFNLSLC